MAATVTALHASTRSRAPLVPLTRARAVEDRGIEGDRHSLPRNRRGLLFMEHEVLDELGLAPGQVREQVTVRGLGLAQLPDGARLGIGEALFEVGGPCAPCERMDEIEPGLRGKLEGRRGRFARVLRGGTFAVGDAIELIAGA